jgi:ATP-binding cassette subfamily F protein uup
VSHDRAFLNDVVTSTLAIEADGRVKEYDGGYDDYLRQRRDEAPVESKAAPAAGPSSSTSPKSPAERPRKLSHKERKELEALPGQIEELEAARADLHDAMADPSFYRQDGGAIADAKARLEAIEGELASAYERWEALEGLAG